MYINTKRIPNSINVKDVFLFHTEEEYLELLDILDGYKWCGKSKIGFKEILSRYKNESKLIGRVIKTLEIPDNAYTALETTCKLSQYIGIEICEKKLSQECGIFRFFTSIELARVSTEGSYIFKGSIFYFPTILFNNLQTFTGITEEELHTCFLKTLEDN